MKSDLGSKFHRRRVYNNVSLIIKLFYDGGSSNSHYLSWRIFYKLIEPTYHETAAQMYFMYWKKSYV